MADLLAGFSLLAANSVELLKKLSNYKVLAQDLERTKCVKINLLSLKRIVSKQIVVVVVKSKIRNLP